MLKPDSLRRALTDAVTVLKTNPDMLRIFVDNGSIASTLATSLSFDAPRDKCTLSCAINGIHAAFHYLKKNYISGCVMTVPTG
ncbi:TPA: hypothetical protein IGM77_003770 [Escherichia coli]|nr:hypothetical protein [Escherichia coli]